MTDGSDTVVLTPGGDRYHRPWPPDESRLYCDPTIHGETVVPVDEADDYEPCQRRRCFRGEADV